MSREPKPEQERERSPAAAGEPGRAVFGMASWLLGPAKLSDRLRWIEDVGLKSASLDNRDLLQEDAARRALDAVKGLGLSLTLHLGPGELKGAGPVWPWSTPGGACPSFPGTERLAFRNKREVFLILAATAGRLAGESGRVACVSLDPAWRNRRGKVLFDREGTLWALRETSRALAGTGVPLALENWKINSDWAEFERLAREAGADAKLGMLLDLGHLNLLKGDPAERASMIPLPIYEVHVHDNSGESDEHLPLGRGALPLERIVEGLRENSAGAVWTLEFRLALRGEVDLADERVRRTVLDSMGRLRRAVRIRGAYS